ncbi:acyl-CoA dehydrogenase family protein [Amycolatopsis jiangsuensis]|uniref:Alkylation response protein AidB-like acyl-CoA dehydrogenase n=1 Tax=Amycolatopsis jiangsuensis TaxID=1181879 RepID=A0A840IYU8_9PSEU|nr:acyl-CoA dehydrogenase family protein [Amycolatopsis jiangsuensis]MBB4687000.1 alkylation response protein AidB-like acyl-CoA dehydrogenase [Amycolatopsis jiangsuensis]
MLDLVARARALADDLLFPAAAEVDERGVVPRSHFDALAAEGLYGLAAPAEAGGPGLAFTEMVQVLETITGGCLSTGFTWLQHHGLVAGLAGSDRAGLRERYLPDLISGALRGGSAYAGVIPTPPRVRARKVNGGYRFDGDAPFVSGWGTIDLLQLSGRDGDTVVNAVVAARPGNGVAAQPLRLVAAQGTATVRLTLDDYFVPDEQVFSEVEYAQFVSGNTFASRFNGCAPLGLAERCARLIEDSGQAETAATLRAEQDGIRKRLDAGLADPATLPSARAAGSDLAYRSAGALAVATGSRAVLTGGHAGRLIREATFLLVAASRPEIRDELLALACRP